MLRDIRRRPVRRRRKADHGRPHDERRTIGRRARFKDVAARLETPQLRDAFAEADAAGVEQAHRGAVRIGAHADADRRGARQIKDEQRRPARRQRARLADALRDGNERARGKFEHARKRPVLGGIDAKRRAARADIGVQFGAGG